MTILWQLSFGYRDASENMENYINNITIDKLGHLQDIPINLANEKGQHLIITGKNGSGKTIFLNALAEYLVTNLIKPQKMTCHWWKSLSVEFSDSEKIEREYASGEFILAFYEAARRPSIQEPDHPTKPDLQSSGSITKNITSQLLNFLSDLKIQEALARNEGQLEDAEYIRKWFGRFEEILQKVFDEENLKLSFNYKDYTFTITTGSKHFKFTQLPDGFAAMLDIVADLILKMQPRGNISAEFNRPGIVLIDEVETHLHLKLQKTVLPTLTTLFPNVQFIVTTHSPFVLNSLNNATAIDLEHQEMISDLTDYSYQALMEGYFGVTMESDYARKRYRELEKLLDKDSLSDSEKETAKQIIEDYKKIPEEMSPNLVGAYQRLIIEKFSKIKELGA